MELLQKLSREAQIVLGGSVLYLVISFFDWQQVSSGPFTYGWSEWRGVGIIAGLLVLALLAWEAVRVLDVKIELGSLSPGLISVGLAFLLLLFTIITFLTHNEARHWPSWIGLLLALVVAGAAFVRAKAEGVEMPDLGALQAKASNGTGGSSAAAEPPAAPPAAAEEPPPAPPEPSA